MIKIIIPGDPIPQRRPEFARRGSYVFTYDPSSQKKKEIQKSLLGQKFEILPPPLSFKVIAYFRIPKSLSLKKQKKLEGKYHTKRPDGDNCLKFVKDLLQGICYQDDSHICHEQITKLYDYNPRVEIEIEQL